MLAISTSRLFLIAALALQVASPAHGSTIYVSPNGGGGEGYSWADALRSIQSAMNWAQPGDEIWVAKGTYVEHITLRNGIALYGGFAGTETQLSQRNWTTNRTIIDGNQLGSVVTVASGASPTTRIDGFIITNGKALQGGGIYCNAASPTIANNTILGNYAGENSGSGAPSGGGIFCSNSAALITKNKILGNTAFSQLFYSPPPGSKTPGEGVTTALNGSLGGGILCLNCGGATIANNIIAANAAGGIRLDSSSISVIGNTIAKNGGYAFYANNCYPTMANNIVAFNTSGTFASSSLYTHNCFYGNAGSTATSPPDSDGNFSADPQLASTTYGNFHIQPTSPCKNAGTTDYVVGDKDIDGQPRIYPSYLVDIGADESLGANWPAGPYAVVRVGWPGDDANDGSSWSAAKRTVGAAIQAAALAGGEVWVRGATYREHVILHPHVYLYGGFAGTEASRDERDYRRHPTVLDGDNTGTVVTVRAGLMASTIDGLTITQGASEGISCWACDLSIANNTIANNGTGIKSSESAPIIAHNVIRNNGYAIGGAGGWPTIVNNIMTANSTGIGGYCFQGSVINNTFVANDVGLDFFYANATTANNIVAFNQLGVRVSYTPVTFKYNCVFGNVDYNYYPSGPFPDPTGTDGNISADPRFVRAKPGPDNQWATADDDLSDLRLEAGSACVDSGDDTALPADTLDLDHDTNTTEPIPVDFAGQPRVVDHARTWNAGPGSTPYLDMGAYEGVIASRGDIDNDGDVDLSDAVRFEFCATGPAVPYSPTYSAPNCPLVGYGIIAADLDEDGDVDQCDFAVLQRNYGSTQ